MPDDRMQRYAPSVQSHAMQSRRKFVHAAAAALLGTCLPEARGRDLAGSHVNLGALGFSPMPAKPLPTWVETQPPWTWFEISGTAPSSIAPAVKPLGMGTGRARIDAWCGAALKRSGSVYLIGAAGGHGDYAGNEVTALALNTARPAWQMLLAPSPNSDVVNDVQFYLDGRPSSTHTYYATQFIESLDRLIVFASRGGQSYQYPAPPAGYRYTGDTRSYSFDLATDQWDPPDAIAPYPGTGNWIAALCVKHPVTDDVYYARGGANDWYRWSPADNTWTPLHARTRSPWYAGCAIDPRRQRMLLVGGYKPAPPEVRDLHGAFVGAAFAGLGEQALMLDGYPGVVYDEVLDAFLVFANEAAGVRTLRVDADTWAVGDAGVSGELPTARRNGILNAVQYVPELRGVVLANRYDGNVMFMRTSS